ncbi:hypothetical protein RBB50_006044 [Rhinocladiella similis]
MFRRSPLLGAAVVYGASRAGAKRGMQREYERQQMMELEYQRQEAVREARRREEAKRREEELEKEKAKVRKEIEQEEREKAKARADQQYTRQPSHPQQDPQHGYQQPGPAVDVVFCTQCGNRCKVGDRFCSGCGKPLPKPPSPPAKKA